MAISLSIDCMGGDLGLEVTVPAAVSFAKRVQDCELALVGNSERIRCELARIGAPNDPRLCIVQASEVVTMADPLEVALRRKKDSSMRIAISLVKDGKANACVSAGNTGALMAVSRYILKTLPGIDRPAICMFIPNQRGRATYMLDLGANVDCLPVHLRQFALLGSAFVSTMEQKVSPTIGLLNIGTDENVGSDIVRQTAVLLRDDSARGLIHFHGYVEGHDILEGTTDVVVCDGFVGNTVLKSIEGLAKILGKTIKDEFTHGALNMLGAFLAQGAFKAAYSQIKPARYNGGTLLGLRGLVFKSHGNANAEGFEWAIQRAYDASSLNVLQRTTQAIERIQTSSQQD